MSSDRLAAIGIPKQFDILQVGQQWRHYKGQLYEIVSLPRASSDDPDIDCQLAVVYRVADAPMARPWVQPAARFLGLVRKGPEWNVPRFTLVAEVPLPPGT